MGEYSAVNILDMIDAIGEEALTGILSDFSCPKNEEIETFVKYKAIDFAKRKISITHLVIDNASGEIVSIFTLAHKALEISREALSVTSRKKLSRFAHLDENNDSYTVSAFLIAQFGKNYAVAESDDWNGVRLMEKTFETLEKVRREIGGGVVYLECEDKPNLLKFYQSTNNRFYPFDERYSKVDDTKYIQLLRFF